jgi:hypothetical protein
VIPVILRIIPLQVATVLLFGLGGLLGSIHSDGRVLLDYGYYELKNPATSIFVLLALAALLTMLSTAVRPLSVRLDSQKSQMGIIIASGYVLIALGLMAFNWMRVDVWQQFLAEAAGSIAFRLQEQGGMIVYYSSMILFFVGASYLLDHAKGGVRTLVWAAIVVFALGLFGLTRREMLLLLVFWLFLYGSTTNRLRWTSRGLWLLGLLSAVALYFSLLLRGIDILDDPLSYFASGEFEPFRFAAFLIDSWLQDPVYVSPLAYAIPFGSDQFIASVNNFFNALLLGESGFLGRHTVTIYVTVLYFGFLVPVVFFCIATFLARQSAHFLERSPSYQTAFYYAFFLMKLFIILRNGELLASLVDTAVLLIVAVPFHLLVRTRLRRDQPATA